MKFYLYTILLIGTLFSTAFAVTTKTIPATKAPPRTTTKTCAPKSFTIVHPFGKTLFGACSKANGRFSYYVDSKDCSNVWNCSSKFDISCPSYFNSLYENYYYSSQKGQEFDFVYHDNDCGYDYQGKTYYSYNTGKTLPDKSTTTTKTLPGKTTTTTTKTLPGKTTTTTTKTLPLGSCVPVTKYVTEVETITKIEKITVTVTGNSSPTPTEDLSHCALKYEQCGGKNFNGPTCCQSGSKCVPLNDYYSQCI